MTHLDVLRYKAQGHPPPWKAEPPLESRTPGPKRRSNRMKAFGGNPFYEYTVGVNLTVLSGTVTRPPVWHGRKGAERVWFRMRVPNRDRAGQNLYISVRSKGPMGLFVYENVCAGDVVAVSGQLWTARIPRAAIKLNKSGMYVFVDAERVTSAYPALIDQDPRYVRVRADLWNRFCELLSDENLPLVPEARAKELQARFDKLAGLRDDEENADDVDDLVKSDPGDPDPGTSKEHRDETDLGQHP